MSTADELAPSHAFTLTPMQQLAAPAHERALAPTLVYDEASPDRTCYAPYLAVQYLDAHFNGDVNSNERVLLAVSGTNREHNPPEHWFMCRYPRDVRRQRGMSLSRGVVIDGATLYAWISISMMVWLPDIDGSNLRDLVTFGTHSRAYICELIENAVTSEQKKLVIPLKASSTVTTFIARRGARGHLKIKRQPDGQWYPKEVAVYMPVETSDHLAMRVKLTHNP